jgi:hypothetical protein
MDTMGGSELMVPTQAMVMMLGATPASAQLTITTGVGDSRVPGFMLMNDITLSLILPRLDAL